LGCGWREEGPVVVSYPEGVWFTLKTESDIDLFVKEYILENSENNIKNLQLTNSK
jgi:(2Fe-2S) ferredoxin